MASSLSLMGLLKYIMLDGQQDPTTPSKSIYASAAGFLGRLISPSKTNHSPSPSPSRSKFPVPSSSSPQKNFVADPRLSFAPKPPTNIPGKIPDTGTAADKVLAELNTRSLSRPVANPHSRALSKIGGAEAGRKGLGMGRSPSVTQKLSEKQDKLMSKADSIATHWSTQSRSVSAASTHSRPGSAGLIRSTTSAMTTMTTTTTTTKVAQKPKLPTVLASPEKKRVTEETQGGTPAKRMKLDPASSRLGMVKSPSKRMDLAALANESGVGGIPRSPSKMNLFGTGTKTGIPRSPSKPMLSSATSSRLPFSTSRTALVPTAVNNNTASKLPVPTSTAKEEGVKDVSTLNAEANRRHLELQRQRRRDARLTGTVSPVKARAGVKKAPAWK
ncbi:hypothetical protein YB2330_004860 [Saitoella coloradoensis]